MRSKPAGDLEQALLEKGEAGMLQEYAAEYARLRAIVVDKLKALKENPGAGEVKEVEQLLGQIHANSGQVKVQLKLELSGAPASLRHDWEARLQEWNREAQSFRSEVEALKSDNQRRALQLPTAAGGFEMTSERQAAMQSTELLERSTAQLEKARMQALETEQISEGILSDLAMQRETIQHISTNIHVVDEQLSNARRVLDTMTRLAMRNRMITMAVTLILSLMAMIWVLTVALGQDTLTTCLLATIFVALGAGAMWWRQKRAQARG
mmetsp:Transcript_67318/g.161404  ORF Transcript_67318/g.161404 Transcript_67318/m.161404 type:complete len:267 (-) Transcript_67318:172-972(-)